MEASLGCSSSVDCGFLLDESGSIGASNFNRDVTNFLRTFITEFDDSGLNQKTDSVGTRFAVSTFSSGYTQEFCFGEHKSLAAYTNAVNSIRYNGGRTFLASALRKINSLFTERCGMRAARFSIPRVLIVMTDGKASDGNEIAVWRWLKPERK